MCADCEGSSYAAYRKKERMAVRRTLRLLIALPRCCSKVSRNALIKGASRSVRFKLEGDFPHCSCAKFKSKRNVSPVRGDRMWTGLALSHQALGEVTLQQGRQGGRRVHGCTSQRFSNRRAACCRSSEVPDRYQNVSLTCPWPKKVESTGKRRSTSSPA